MMESIQLDALRDLAIDHLPQAQVRREQAKQWGSSHNEFNMALAHTAVSVRAKAGTTAVEYAAANLLEAVMLICCERDTKLTAAQHQATLSQVVATAKELCELTGRGIPWLDRVAKEIATPPAPPVTKPTRAQVPPHTAPEEQPTTTGCIYAGRSLKTDEAAKALGREPQTLLSWSSKQNGPLQPTKVGRLLMWSGDTICKLLKEGTS